MLLLLLAGAASSPIDPRVELCVTVARVTELIVLDVPMTCLTIATMPVTALVIAGALMTDAGVSSALSTGIDITDALLTTVAVAHIVLECDELSNNIDIGDVVRISWVFTRVADSVAVDPDGVILMLKQPNATVTTYTYLTDAALVKDSAGHYHFDYTPTASGKHVYKAVGTGTSAAAEPGDFTVRQDVITGA